jgi:hypothetical protein
LYAQAGHEPTRRCASLLGTTLWFNAPSTLSDINGGGSWPDSKVPRSERPIGVNTCQTKDGRFLQFVMPGDHDEVRQAGLEPAARCFDMS